MPVVVPEVPQRLACAHAAQFDQFLGAMELVERAGVARNWNYQVGWLCRKLEARDRLLHHIERASEQFQDAGIAFRGRFLLALFNQAVEKF